MNQQQLQNARTALWRQNGQPLLTEDEATSWLDEMGICLFLPRHAQLPAPAPSFVEACAGEARAVPAPPAIDAATALMTRMVAEGRAVPLNLMGNLAEQPDFVASSEALRWIAAVRGDRNWKAAPGGRTAPLVRRVWEALDQAPGRTAVEIREELGRELTEAAVMRALVELWTTLRAAPAYETGEPTRWSLMRDRSPKEMAAGANTAQTTALSALISLYLRQAVAATGEETEIFLSPLTARSRIREVVHGMLAAGQFGTMAMGVQTLLYLEGTLPESVEEEAESQPSAAVASPASESPERAAQRKPWAQRRTEQRPDARPEPRREFRREPSRPFARVPQRESRPRDNRPRENRPERGERRAFGAGKKRPFRPGPRPDWKRGPRPEQGPENRRAFGKPGGKPWQKREGSAGRPAESRPGREFGPRREGKREFRREGKPGGWQAPRRREGENQQEGRPEGREFRPENRREFRPGDRERGAERREFRRDDASKKPGRGPFLREGGAERPKFGQKPGGPRGEVRAPGAPRGAGRRPGKFGERPSQGAPGRKPPFGKSSGRFGKPGGKFGKPGGPFRKSGEGSGRLGGQRFGKPGGGRFGKPGGGSAKPAEPGARRPWQNRPDKTGPKGPRSGKNRKEQKDQPE